MRVHDPGRQGGDPPVTSDILESITRRTVMTLCDEYLGMEVVERDIDRSEFAAADEAFFCGTAWEVTPLVSVDRLAIGDGTVGPAVRRLQEVFFGIATGALTAMPSGERRCTAERGMRA